MCVQNFYNIANRADAAVLAATAEQHIAYVPYFPLASGLLTGKYKRGAAAPDDTRFAKAPALKDRYVTARNEDIVEKLQETVNNRPRAA